MKIEIVRLLKHTMIYGFGNIIGKMIGFLMIPVYTRYLTTIDYGCIELLSLVSSILYIVLSCGMGVAIFKYYAIYKVEVDKKELISTAFIFSCCITCFVVCLLIPARRLISIFLFGSPTNVLYINLILLTAVFEICAIVPLAYLQVREKSFLFTLVTLMRLLVGFVLNIYLIVFLKMGVYGVLLSGLITAVIALIGLVIVTSINAGFNFSFNKLGKLLIYGLPVVPAGISMFIVNFSDRFFLNSFCDLGQVGIYSLGYKFGSVIGFLITQPFMLIWPPFLFSVEHNKDAKRIYARVFTYFTVVIISFGFILSLFIKDIIHLITGPGFLDSYKIVPIIILGIILWSISYIFQVGVYLKNKTYVLTIISIITSVSNILFNYLLVPRFKMYGAAFSSLFTFLLLASLTYWISNKYYRIKYEFSRVIKVFLIGLVLYFLSQLMIIPSVFVAIIIKAVIALIFVSSLLFFGFLEKDERAFLQKFLGSMYFNKS